MRREPLNRSGIKLIVPDTEIAKEEKRIFVLGLHPRTWFENRVRRIFVVEIKTPDMRVWNDWSEFSTDVLVPIETMIVLLFFVEMYKLGIRDDNEIYQKWEEFAHAPDWIEFFNDVVMHRTNKEWWENVKPKFEELKQKKVDTLYSRGKYLGDIEFTTTFEYPTGEQLRKALEEFALVNGYGYPMKLYGQDCGKFAMEKLLEENEKLDNVSVVFSV